MIVYCGYKILFIYVVLLSKMGDSKKQSAVETYELEKRSSLCFIIKKTHTVKSIETAPVEVMSTVGVQTRQSNKRANDIKSLPKSKRAKQSNGNIF